MAKQVLLIGTNVNDGTGDIMRDAFKKVNENFEELYQHAGGNSTSNIRFDSTSLTSAAQNSDVILSPNGTGAVKIDALRMRISTTRVPLSSIGIEGDIAGDVSMDSNYIYRCVANYDGVNHIWKRLAFDATPW